MSLSASSRKAWDKFFERHLTKATNEQATEKTREAGSSASETPESILRGDVPESPIAAHASYKDASGDDGAKTGSQTVKQRRAKSARNLRHTYKASHSMAFGRLPRPITEVEYEETVKRLCKLVLVEGVPDEEEYTLPKGHDGTSARALIWKLLLDVRTLDPVEYLGLVAQGPSVMHDKICNDASRTLATDAEFKGRVEQDALIRILDAFVWKHAEHADGTGGDLESMAPPHDDFDGTLRFGYVQGMNALAAPFLYVMPSEIEAFYCFCAFIETRCPTYIQPTLVGVHRAMELLDRCLQMADPSLASHLREVNLQAELYAFASVLTLCACTPPLKQLLPLWDFLLAFGTHLCVPCVVAQLLMMRDDLMGSEHPMKLLRNLPELDAATIIGIATTIVRDLDEAFYDELVRHATQL